MPEKFSLGHIITSLWFIGCVVVALAVWTAWGIWRLYSVRRNLERALNEASAQISQASADGAMADQFDILRLSLEKNTLIADPWRGFAETVILPDLPGRQPVAAQAPEEWFELGALFRSAGTDLRFHAAMPGMLVGAGLMFTFLGLTFALGAAGGVVEGGSADRLQALKSLLDAASLKFITSLAGLFLSLVYAMSRKHNLHVAEKAFDRFVFVLRGAIPFRSVASLQVEANELLSKQFTEIQRFSTEFFINLGQTLDREFSNGLSQHMAPLASAIERLSERLSGQNEGAVGQMLQTFLTRLEGAVGESMRGTADTLKVLQTGLSDMRGAMDGAATRMAAAAEEMASGMGRGTQAAIDAMTREMASLIGAMREAASEAERGNRAAGQEMAKLMVDAATTLNRAMEEFQKTLQKGALDGVTQLHAPLQAMLAQLEILASQQRQAGADANAAMADGVNRAAAALEATASGIANALGEGANTASARLVAATEAMRDDLRGVLARFGESLEMAGGTVAEKAREGGKQLTDAAVAAGGNLERAAAEIARAGEAAGADLRGGGADARIQMAEAGRLLVEGAGGLGGRLAALAQATDNLATQAAALDQAARGAAAPLQSSAGDMRAAAEAARAAAAPLGQAAGAMQATMDALRNLATGLTEMQRTSRGLTEELTMAAGRLNGVDQAIAKSTAGLAGSLDDFRRQAESFVSGMDGGLEKSVRHLHGVAQRLADAVEDLPPDIRKPPRPAPAFTGSGR
jgi:uncharacterized phage infection (PIP) family protein YhgE